MAYRFAKTIDKKTLIRKSKGWLWSVFRLLLLIGLAFVMLYPILYMFSVSFRLKNDMFDTTVQWIPKHFTFENISRVAEALKYSKSLSLTFGMSALCAFLSAAICSVTAYGLARFKFKCQGLLFVLMILMVVVPAAFYRMPLYMIMNKLHLLNSPLSMIIPATLGVGIRSGLYIYLFRQFFKGMPKELEEAAYIDGCGYFKTFTKIMIPSATAIFVTAFLFAFVWYWNDFQLGQLFMQEIDGVSTLSASLSNLDTVLYAAFPEVPTGAFDEIQFTLDKQAASLLVIGPLLLVYIVCQRFFVENISRTGIVE